MQPFQMSPPLRIAITLLAVGLCGDGVVRAQDSLRAERTVEFVPGRPQTLDAKVGPVRIETIELTNRGRNVPPSFSRTVRGADTDSEASTTLHARIAAQNPTADEWEVTFVFELLDKSGKVIERVTKKSSWEGEAKPFEFDHTILEYVVPLIAQVRVSLQARLD